MRSALLALFLAGLVPALLFADEQRFAFAVPEAEGRISLGAYDESGKLVRTLYAGAEQKDFQIGLNGLLASWDGKNDAGVALPAGKYDIRGWLVADAVQAEGVAYHFNDWIVDEASPEISGIGAVAPGVGDAFLLFGFHPGRDAAEEALWSYSEPEGLRLVENLPVKSIFLAAENSTVAVSDRGENATWLYSRKEPGKPLRLPNYFAAGAFWKKSLYLRPEGDKNELMVQSLSIAGQEMTRVPAPAPDVKLDANAAALMAWDAGKIWLRRAEAFELAPIAELPKNFHASAGSEETLWVAGRSGADIMARQHAFGGELLREMKIQEDFAEEIRIFASKDSLSFFLLLHSGNWSRQTLRGYRPAASPAPSSNGEPLRVDWEIFLDKTIENSRRFGLSEGKLVPNVGAAPQSTERKISLPADAMTGKKMTVVLQAITTPRGLWLSTADGLPLLNLTGASTFNRFVIAAGEGPGSLRLYAGNGVVVAEYLFTGLDALTPIDAGEVELP